MLSKEELHELYINQQLTAKEIADKTGFAQSTIACHISRHEISKQKSNSKIRKSGSIIISDEQLKLNFLLGKNATDIAKEYAVHPSTIQRRFKKLGLKTELIKIGSEFGILEVKEDCGKKLFESKEDQIYNCLCKCGKYKKCRRSRLLDGRNISCGCLENIHKPRTYKNGLYIASSLWQRLQTNAKKRNLEFSITKEYILDLFIKQNHKCAITKKDISLPISPLDTNLSNLASLDRIENTKGYVIGNVRWVMWKINRMKWNMSDNEFIELCSLVIEGTLP